MDTEQLYMKHSTETTAALEDCRIRVLKDLYDAIKKTEDTMSRILSEPVEFHFHFHLNQNTK
jgi:hypothetical protein